MSKSGIMVNCPFAPCSSVVRANHVRAMDLGTPGVDMIEEHTVAPDSWFGLCPASHMIVPLEDLERTQLKAQEQVFRLMKRARSEKPGGERPAMFTPTGSQGSKDVGPQAHPNRLLPHPEPRDNPVTAQAGASMSGPVTVAQTRAAIYEANAAIAEAQAAAQAAAEKFKTARDQVSAIVSSGVDPLSGPTLNAAIEAVGNAIQLSLVAVEINNTYEVGM